MCVCVNSHISIIYALFPGFWNLWVLCCFVIDQLYIFVYSCTFDWQRVGGPWRIRSDSVYTTNGCGCCEMFWILFTPVSSGSLNLCLYCKITNPKTESDLFNSIPNICIHKHRGIHWDDDEERKDVCDEEGRVSVHRGLIVKLCASPASL